MSTSDYQFPVTGITGPTFRDNLSEAFQALVTSNSSDGVLPVTFPGMTRVLEGTSGNPDKYQIRNASDDGWIDLFPDLSKTYGGLEDVVGVGDLLSGDNSFTGVNTFNADSIFKTTATFDSTVLFKGNVTFDNNPGFVTPSQQSTAIANAVSGLSTFGANSFTIDLDPNLNTTTTTNHGLGGVPKLVTVDIRLQRAAAGYDDNQVLLGSQFAAHQFQSGGFTFNTGFTVRFDSSAIQIATGNFLEVVNRNTNQVERLDDSNDFAYIVKAYR